MSESARCPLYNNIYFEVLREKWLWSLIIWRTGHWAKGRPTPARARAASHLQAHGAHTLIYQEMQVTSAQSSLNISAQLVHKFYKLKNFFWIKTFMQIDKSLKELLYMQLQK